MATWKTEIPKLNESESHNCYISYYSQMESFCVTAGIDFLGDVIGIDGIVKTDALDDEAKKLHTKVAGALRGGLADNFSKYVRASCTLREFVTDLETEFNCQSKMSKIRYLQEYNSVPDQGSVGATIARRDLIWKVRLKDGLLWANFSLASILW